eukprot:TRINITY_DN9112_c0_g1_i3.p1 TRINITY_DN9112_c0_g1~~TRINITY_DN9112_c0_g1_i3.p1  ORF type:complete len:397 (+),score=104.33 TRINITY_DN9112_c0_g1_i3:119-1192(+)
MNGTASNMFEEHNGIVRINLNIESMDNTIIKRNDIRSVADRLNEVASKRKEGLSPLLTSIKFAEEIISSLRATIEKAHKQLKSEEREIDNIKKIAKRLSRLEVISSASSTFDEDVLPYVEGESIISSYDEKLNNAVEPMKAEMLEIAEKIKRYVKEGRYEQKKEEVKLAIQEEEKLIPKVLDEPKKEAEGVQIKVNDKIGVISNLPANPRHEEDYVAELVVAEKMCELCRNFTRYALILSCRCSLCLKCLKEKLLKENEHMLSSTFEAYKKRNNAMYACPTHGTSIEAKVLEAICGEEIVERASIEAMKRQLQECALSKKFYPTLCMLCRNIIRDETDSYSSITLCSKHKLCTNCNM